MELWNYLISHQIISWSAIPIAGVVGYFFKEWKDERRERRKQKASEKDSIIKEIIELCAEAKIQNFNMMSTQQEQRMEILSYQTKMIDSDLRYLVSSFYVAWMRSTQEKLKSNKVKTHEVEEEWKTPLSIQIAYTNLLDYIKKWKKR